MPKTSKQTTEACGRTMEVVGRNLMATQGA
jgi:hypothetical protein